MMSKHYTLSWYNFLVCRLLYLNGINDSIIIKLKWNISQSFLYESYENVKCIASNINKLQKKKLG